MNDSIKNATEATQPAPDPAEVRRRLARCYAFLLELGRRRSQKSDSLQPAASGDPAAAPNDQNIHEGE